MRNWFGPPSKGPPGPYYFRPPGQNICWPLPFCFFLTINFKLVLLCSVTVTNVRVEQVSGTNTSVMVSWDRVSGVTGYKVYYSPVSSRIRQDERAVTVSSAEDTSITLTGLMSCVQYQFQVAIMAESPSQIFEGNRSAVSDQSMITPYSATPPPGVYRASYVPNGAFPLLCHSVCMCR